MFFQVLPSKLEGSQLECSFSFDQTSRKATHLCHWAVFGLPLTTGQNKYLLEKTMLSIFTIEKSNMHFNSILQETPKYKNLDQNIGFAVHYFYPYKQYKYLRTELKKYPTTMKLIELHSSAVQTL